MLHRRVVLLAMLVIAAVCTLSRTAMAKTLNLGYAVYIEAIKDTGKCDVIKKKT